MIYERIASFQDAVPALAVHPTDEERRVKVCETSRLLAYEMITALLFYRGLITDEMIETVRALFNRAIGCLECTEDVYLENVRFRRREIEAATETANQRDQEDEAFLEQIAEKFPETTTEEHFD